MIYEPVFTQNLQLPYSMLGANKHVRMDRILSLFQDAAGFHSHQMGVSGFDLAKKQLKWVISRYQVRMQHRLHWPGPYELKTWRYPWKNLYEIRQFEINSPQGVTQIQALSVWVMVRAETTRPVRLSYHMPPALMDNTAHLTPELWANTPDLTRWDHEKRLHIRMHDLDLNQHVNNTRYLAWALESLPMQWLFDHIPVTLVIDFLKETFYPGTVTVKTAVLDSTEPKTTCHGIFNETGDETVAVLTLTWRSNPDVPVY